MGIWQKILPFMFTSDESEDESESSNESGSVELTLTSQMVPQTSQVLHPYQNSFLTQSLSGLGQALSNSTAYGSYTTTGNSTLYQQQQYQQMVWPPPAPPKPPQIVLHKNPLPTYFNSLAEDNESVVLDFKTVTCLFARLALLEHQVQFGKDHDCEECRSQQGKMDQIVVEDLAGLSP